MTQLSTGTDGRTAHAAALRPTTVEKPRHPGRGLFGKGNGSAAALPGLIDEQSGPAVSPEIPGISPDADMWEEGRAAARSGTHERAMACFVREAEARTLQGSHGRAAIAFRTAAEQARLQGLAEQCEDLLYRAAAAYNHAAERDELSPGAAHQALISAAKCFLQLQELDQAARCIEAARHVADQTHVKVESAQTAS
ncbi:hypothetical protein F8G81_17845 [Arthrobacter sp. CDRTa11]|uniref:hypothetical protein n=1 Tax=Arthrobacter sp. CDRTa11 TaxID=2651199 RepID=UPI0022658FF1|nr:hypothetical protein [Arthrobacter sp. CDRTa11]UZX04262.1 hypothetical protein F8G81_17845 [Arthrobacter sp. CDRTa11]